MINCVILEDEKPAQQVLQQYIKKTPFLNLINTYESGLDIPKEVIDAADLLFLDVQLPEITGLTFLKSLSNPPKVIVTTAFSNYAIEAFEAAVIDYLLKPFSYERFFKAVDRVRNLSGSLEPSSTENVFVYADKAFFNIQLSHINFLKAEVDYVKIDTHQRDYLILDSLKNWKEKLKGRQFIQCHRSYIVNMNKVKKVYDNQVHFEDGTQIPIGNTYKSLLIQSIKA